LRRYHVTLSRLVWLAVKANKLQFRCSFSLENYPRERGREIRVARESAIDDIASPDNLRASNRREYEERERERERERNRKRVSEFWDTGSIHGNIANVLGITLPYTCADIPSSLPFEIAHEECAGREIRRGYLIYAIERAQEGYLNNAIRILL